jgi:hypothetical protein
MKQYIQQLKWFLYASIYKLQNWWFLWKKKINLKQYLAWIFSQFHKFFIEKDFCSSFDSISSPPKRAVIIKSQISAKLVILNLC